MCVDDEPGVVCCNIVVCAVLFELMDVCVYYDLVILKYLSKPKNVVSL